MRKRGVACPVVAWQDQTRSKTADKLGSTLGAEREVTPSGHHQNIQMTDLFVHVACQPFPEVATVKHPQAFGLDQKHLCVAPSKGTSKFIMGCPKDSNGNVVVVVEITRDDNRFTAYPTQIRMVSMFV